MMRAEQGRAKPPELPKRRGRKKKEESPIEMEGLRDASELAADTDTGNDDAERKRESAEMIENKIEGMLQQKEVNLRNPALSESMASKINAEIDKNVTELRGRLPAKSGKKNGNGKSSRAKEMAERVDERMGLDEESEAALAAFRNTLEKKRAAAEEDADIVTSAPTMEKLGIKPMKDSERPTPEQVGEGRKKMRAEREAGLEAMEKMLLAKEQSENEEKMRAAAAQEAEDAFFARGEKMSAAHQAGETIEKNAAEMDGERGEQRQRLAERAELLRAELPGLQNAVTAAERRLHREFGIADADAEMTKRASSGWESVKSFFGGLFSKKESMKNAALEDYRRLRDRHSDRQEELNETENRLNRPEQVAQAMKLKAERRKP